PVRQQFQVAVSKWAGGTDGDCKLIASEIFFTNPCSGHRKVFDDALSVNRFFVDRKKLNCASAFPQRFFLPSQPGVDQTKHAERWPVAFRSLKYVLLLRSRCRESCACAWVIVRHPGDDAFHERPTQLHSLIGEGRVSTCCYHGISCSSGIAVGQCGKEPVL